MKKFELTPDMLTIGGTFYPKGYAFIMFPDAVQAEHAAADIDNAFGQKEVALFLDSGCVLRDIGRVSGDSDIDLPAIGTEGATVRKYVELARQGHCALMVKVHSDEETERIMQFARKANFSYGQRYHLLAIEDLE
jgi:hypothetical protein